jgi:hypothetical protein
MAECSGQSGRARVKGHVVSASVAGQKKDKKTESQSSAKSAATHKKKVEVISLRLF